MKTTDTVRILTWLASNPGSTSGEIATAVGLSRQYVHVCLLGAEIAGRARRDRERAAAPWRWERRDPLTPAQRDKITALSASLRGETET